MHSFIMTTAAIQQRIKTYPKGKPFASKAFLKLGSRTSVDQAFSRLVKSGDLSRITSGIYVRPKTNRFVGKVMPEMAKIVATIAKTNGETIQVHGAEAARQFKLTTQVPAQHMFYTSGSTREVSVGNLKIRFVHAARRKLQLAGTRAGAALSALWFLGKQGVSESSIRSVCSSLEPSELSQLMAAEVPSWLADHLSFYQQRAANG